MYQICQEVKYIKGFLVKTANCYM